MGLQLIFVVETNAENKSDWIYIKETIDYVYNYDSSHVKFTPVYMGGKNNYKNKLKEIETKTRQYNNSAEGNETEVIYCFDCDEYDNNPEDDTFLNAALKYCKDKKSDFVWFCKDIERVYIKTKVADKEKKKEATKFKVKRLILKVDLKRLERKNYGKDSSNLLHVVDKYLHRKQEYSENP